MLTLIPAYGRDYSSRTAVSEDFDANKDFQRKASQQAPIGSNEPQRSQIPIQETDQGVYSKDQRNDEAKETAREKKCQTLTKCAPRLNPYF